MCICAYGRVCLIIFEGGQRRKEIRTFRKETADPLALRTWLLQEGCSHVAMESTGVYWLPVDRRLEGFFELVVGNAQHSKGVPGRKTDVQDAEWIADRVQYGLIQASFVPSQQQQDVPDLTRMRVSLVQERSRLESRVQKVLEEAGIKLSTVLSDVMGLGGACHFGCLVCRRKRSGAPSQAGTSQCACYSRADRRRADCRNTRAPSLLVTRTVLST
jgi:transposase